MSAPARPHHRARGPMPHDFYDLLDPGSWLESKVSDGGTALPRVREQLEKARAELGG